MSFTNQSQPSKVKLKQTRITFQTQLKTDLKEDVLVDIYHRLQLHTIYLAQFTFDRFSFFRLASDLLLWEPMAPSPSDRPDPCGFSIGTGLDLASQMLQAQGPDRFVMCRSGLRSYDDGK